MTKLFSLLLLVFVHSNIGHAAALKCQGARLSPIDTMICTDEKLSEYDERLNILFHNTIVLSAPHERRQVLDEQQRWLTDVRDKCDSWICLLGAYETRLETLSQTFHERLSTKIAGFVKTDQAMSTVLARKLEELPQSCREKLEIEQSKWEMGRESKCNKEADDKAGSSSMRTMIFTACQAETTEQRKAMLESIRSCDSIR